MHQTVTSLDFLISFNIGEIVCIDRERERNPMNNGVRDLSKTTVSIGHVTAVYFPEAYPKAIDIAFPVVRLSFKNLCNKS